MFKPIHHKSATLPLPKSISRSPLRRGVPLIPFALALALFAASPTARAQLPPPAPDGGYPGNNTAEGDGALSSVQINATTGAGLANTAIGFDALHSNTTGSDNTATGNTALLNNTTGSFNTATGFQALFSNTTGGNNTATGVDALLKNTTGVSNTATGFQALFSNTTGSDNTATGNTALISNTTGGGNTANGWEALVVNTTGNGNTATGLLALGGNTTGSNNTATGVDAGGGNGNNNTATGFEALGGNNGNNNTATGFEALFNNSRGKNNIALGASAGFNLTTGNNNIDIGNSGVAAEGRTIRIGTAGIQMATFIAGISGATASSGAAVFVNSNGQLGTTTSSRRFKQEIKPMDKASEAILALRPVSFRYKQEIDPKGIPQFGLVAEEVEKVNPDLVVRDDEGKVYTVRYEAVNAMLLNEFLKEHRKVEEQGTVIAQQQKNFESKIAQQQKQIEALTTIVQKVSAQVELSRPAPQTVANNQ